MTLRPRAAIMMTGTIGAILLVAAACGGGEEKAPTQAPGAGVVSHRAGAAHSFQPKRLDAVVEIDMHEMYFANPQGVKNPTFRLPAGKTVGIHVHNEGAVMHELAIGRSLKAGEYEQLLTELVPSDLFFYYGQRKAEVEDAKFGELEVEPGIRDTWIRMTIPAELKGEWEIGCLVEGHYEAGMHAKLLVE